MITTTSMGLGDSINPYGKRSANRLDWNDYLQWKMHCLEDQGKGYLVQEYKRKYFHKSPTREQTAAFLGIEDECRARGYIK